jgi:hypothetical protein
MALNKRPWKGIWKWKSGSRWNKKMVSEIQNQGDNLTCSYRSIVVVQNIATLIDSLENGPPEEYSTCSSGGNIDIIYDISHHQNVM